MNVIEITGDTRVGRVTSFGKVTRGGQGFVIVTIIRPSSADGFITNLSKRGLRPMTPDEFLELTAEDAKSATLLSSDFVCSGDKYFCVCK